MVALLPGASSPGGFFAHIGYFVVRTSTKWSSRGWAVLAFRVCSLTDAIWPAREKEPRIAGGVGGL